MSLESLVSSVNVHSLDLGETDVGQSRNVYVSSSKCEVCEKGQRRDKIRTWIIEFLSSIAYMSYYTCVIMFALA